MNEPIASEVLSTLEHEAFVAIDTSEAGIAAASRDFGGLCKGIARGSIRPTSVEQIQRIVRFANDRSIHLTVRGQGMSQSGQSIPRDGFSLDVTGLAEIGKPDMTRMSVTTGPGATWRGLLERLLPAGLIPSVVPLCLDLSVGGTLSAGGFGSTSHRLGPAVSHVLSAEVVTGEGTRRICGPDRERETFDAVLGGLGHYGVITSVELGLRRVPPRVRTHYLVYDDMKTMLEDQLVLSSVEGAAHLEGFCASTVLGMRKNASGRRQPLVKWSFGLHVSEELEQASEPSGASVLSGLRHAARVHVEEDTSLEFASRYDARFAAMRLTGAWNLPHPWLECILSLPDTIGIVPEVLEMLPAFLGDGHRLTLLADTARPTSLAFPSRGPYVSFAILPMGIPEPLLRPALEALRAVHARLVAVGGKRYLSGWLFEPDDNDWRHHHNAAHVGLRAAKVGFDPRGVFESLLTSP
jgi:cytokinin dehydrogenase